MKFSVQFLTTLSALLSIFCSGCHESWTSVYIPQLLNGTPFKITSDQGSLVVSCLQVGGFVGSFVSCLAHKYGRKKILLLSAVPNLISAVLLALANSVWTLCLARFIAGVALGVSVPLCPLYIGEIADRKIRGALGTWYHTFYNVSFMFMNVLGSYLSIKISSYVLCGLTFLFFGTFIWMPESPYYLIMVDKHKEAKQSLVKLRGCKNVEDEFQRIAEAVREQKSNKSTIWDLFRVKSNRRALFILFIVFDAKQMSGDAPLYTYAQTFYLMVCEVLPPTVMSTVFYTTRIIAIIAGSFLVDKIGRKPLFLISLITTSFLLFLIAGYLFIKLHTEIEMSQAVKYGAAVLVVLFSAAFCFVATVPGILFSELFPINVKHFVSLFYGLYFFLSEAASNKLFQVGFDSFGMDVPLFAFSVSNVVHFVLVWIFLFETKGKTLEEIQEYLRQ